MTDIVAQFPAQGSDFPRGTSRFAKGTIGPRRVGATVYTRHGRYEVLDVRLGDAARELVSWSDYALVERDLTGDAAGRIRTHCTAWDPTEAVVLPDPSIDDTAARALLDEQARAVRAAKHAARRARAARR